LGVEIMGSSEGVGTSSKQYGITKPISMAGPTVYDLHRTLELEKVGFFFCVMRYFFLLSDCWCTYSSEKFFPMFTSFSLFRDFMRTMRKLLRERRFFADLNR